MQLLYKNERFQLENNDIAITTIVEKVDEVIKQDDVVFSHLIVDGVEVYENHEKYIRDQLSDITNVEIATRNTKEMIWETMESLHKYLERAVPALNELVDESFEGFSEKTWQGIGQLADGMQWMIQFRTFTEAATQQPLNWEEIVKSFQSCEKVFASLLEAVEVQDTVLISDLLAYELTSAYELLEKNIGMALKDEEFLKDVN